MNYEEEKELLRLTKENNILLKYIASKFNNQDIDSFGINVLANLICRN